MVDKKTILIVEDEIFLSEIYKKTFEKAGFCVQTAFTIKEALSQIKLEKPHIVLLDILLPKETGIFFLKEAKDYLEKSFIPVVVFSNFDDPVARKEALALGAKDYLIKTNYVPKDILKKISKYLNDK